MIPFALASVRHYLTVKTDTCAVIHRRRGEDGRIETAVLHGGPLAPDPSGLNVEIADFFAPLGRGRGLSRASRPRSS